eukprot:XP_001708933.1 Hypothetical protein GL50803_11169 [Giardia lamblia ATCC 50803]
MVEDVDAFRILSGAARAFVVCFGQVFLTSSSHHRNADKSSVLAMMTAAFQRPPSNDLPIVSPALREEM